MTRTTERKPVLGWALYDAGSSAFATTVVGAVLPAYFENRVIPEGGLLFVGGIWTAESLWGLVTGAAPLAALMFLPFLGAMADRSRTKLRLLRGFAYSGCALTTLLFLATDGRVLFTLGVFLIALVLFAGANVFYDSLLPDISTPATVHTVSARGIGYGYIGGGIHLALALVVISVFSTGFASRVAIASAGLWWAAFTFLGLRHLDGLFPANVRREDERLGQRWRVAFSEVTSTVRRLRRFPDLARFLAAYLLYRNGVQSVVVLTAVYSSETLRMDATTIIVAFLIAQILSIPGSFLAGRMATRVSPRSALTLILVIWAGGVGAAYLLPAERLVPFYALAVTIGVALGAVETLSRSIFVTMIPQSSSAEFFGLQSLAAKVTTFSGPLVFAWVRQTTGSGRYAVLALAAFILAGLILFRTVDLDEARLSSQRWPSPDSQPRPIL